MDIGEAFFFEQERTARFAAGNLLPYSLAEFRQAPQPQGSRRRARRRGPPALRPFQDSFLAFSTCRPLYMPVFRSR